MRRILLFSLVMLLSFTVHADWQLSNADSSINFISIKNSAIGEVNHFTSLSGSLIKGKANVTIDLSSVATGIPIRNERMKSMLFEVSDFSLVAITAEIDPVKIENLKAGEHYLENLTLTISLHGVKKDFVSSVQVVKLSNGNLSLHSMYPVIINAKDFGMGNGIEALRVIAKLSVISTAIPVTFNLVFTQ